MTERQSYDVQSSHRDAETEVQRLAAQARITWNKEGRTLGWLGLRDGMSLLEVGSGPGFITSQLLDLLPNSPITCLELDPQLAARARAALQEHGGQRLQIVEGSVMAIDLPEARFDFAYARLLFQHLPDPVGAARQILRVLKPGGRLVIYDVDDELGMLFDPALPELRPAMAAYGQAQAAAGGNRQVGRRLWRTLREAGYEQLELELITAHSDDIGLQAFLPQIDPDRLVPLVTAGLLAEEQLAAVRAARERFLAAPQPFLLMMAMMAAGQKPA